MASRRLNHSNRLLFSEYCNIELRFKVKLNSIQMQIKLDSNKILLKIWRLKDSLKDSLVLFWRLANEHHLSFRLWQLISIYEYGYMIFFNVYFNILNLIVNILCCTSRNQILLRRTYEIIITYFKLNIYFRF